MEYKISELVAKTDVPKSTILYYIREGLLPEAKKIKIKENETNQPAEEPEAIKDELVDFAQPPKKRKNVINNF